LPTQKWRFFIPIQVDQARVIDPGITDLLARGSSAAGYNSSCKMVEPDFRAISSGQLSLLNR